MVVFVDFRAKRVAYIYVSCLHMPQFGAIMVADLQNRHCQLRPCHLERGNGLRVDFL